MDEIPNNILLGQPSLGRRGVHSLSCYEVLVLVWGYYHGQLWPEDGSGMLLLWLLAPQLSSNNVEPTKATGIIIKGDDLNPRIGNDTRIDLVGETKKFSLQEYWGLIKVSVGEEGEHNRQSPIWQCQPFRMDSGEPCKDWPKDNLPHVIHI